MEDYIKQARELGLEGEKAVAFVNKLLERDERAARRAEDRQLKELEAARLAEEREIKALEVSKLEMRLKAKAEERRIEVEMEREEREKEREMEERKRERSFKLEQEKMKFEHQLQLESMEGKKREGENNYCTTKSKVPRLPNFIEGQDEVDAYLERFERYAEKQQWPRDGWATDLSALLTGTALSVYSRLSRQDALVYDKVKEALLTRYELTEEGFRKKFRESLPESGESPQQFINRINNYLMRWQNLSKVEETYEGLRDLIIFEQFINMSGKDLAIHLRERSYKTLEDMAEDAQKYLQAHGKTMASGSEGSRNIGQKDSTENKIDGRVKDKCGNCGFSGHTSQLCRSKGGGDEMRCGICKKFGHKSNTCRWRNQGAAAGGFVPENEVGALCKSLSTNVSDDLSVINVESQLKENEECILLGLNVDKQLKITTGKVGRHIVQTLRDSGCSTVCVNRDLVNDDQYTGEEQTCIFLNGTSVQAPVAMIQIDTPYLKGSVKALCLEHPAYDLVIGDVPNARCKCDPDVNWGNEECVNVVTRSQKKVKALSPLKVRVNDSEVDVTPKILKRMQLEDNSLDKIRDILDRQRVQEKGKCKSWYEMSNEILYRMFSSDVNDIRKQVVVPKELRMQVMKLAHESILGGHLGTKKTYDKILSSFHWPGIHGDVTRFCRSCEVCQKTVPKGSVKKVPLEKVPLIDVPFKRVVVDLVGKIFPTTEKGKRYILTMVDSATRYPDAIALKSITAEEVAEGLVSMFCRLGVPNEILSDQGTQFMSDVMKEVNRLLSIKHLTSTVYHPTTQGLCEKFNGTLKRILKRLCEKSPKQWDRYLDAALFAYREVPQESTGFSPFELLYGRIVRGPMQVLKELWTKENVEETVKTSYQYVVDLREKLETGIALAHENLSKAQDRYKRDYDKKAKVRRFKVGDFVLVLLPTDSNKLLMQWQGPFRVEAIVGKNDYKVNIRGREKMYHINLLKKYFYREDVLAGKGNDATQIGASVMQLVGSAVIESNEASESDIIDDEGLLNLDYVCHQKEDYNDINICEQLDINNKSQLEALVKNHKSIFSDAPGLTTLVEHRISLTDDTPIRCRPYVIPYNCREELRQDIDKMLQMGVIERAESPYAAPPVIVKKPDGTNRICIDYRKINRVTLFDSEPTPVPSDIFVKIAKAQYVSTIDLSKGYWQIPMAVEDIPKTGFVTPEGAFVFRRMPFGLKNSSATFNKMMRIMIAGLDGVDSYIDDIIVYSETWEDHLQILDKLFGRINEVNLHVRPSKCVLGARKVDF